MRDMRAHDERLASGVVIRDAESPSDTAPIPSGPAHERPPVIPSSLQAGQPFGHSLGQYLWVADADGNLRAPATWCALTGQGEADARGHGWLAAVHPDDRERVGQAWRDAVASREGYVGECRVRHRDGTYRDMLLYALYVAADTGDEWIGVASDLTQGKQLRAEVATQAAQLDAARTERETLLRERAQAQASEEAIRQAKRELEEFLSIASHELKTPLTSIRGYLQLAQQRLRSMPVAAPGLDASRTGDASGDLGNRAQESPLMRVRTVLERAEQQTGRLNQLINELLEASRAHASRLELRLARRDLTVTVRDIVEEQRLATPGRELRVDVGPAPIPIAMDAARIGQVLTNMLTNALKYAPADTPVTVTVRVMAEQARVEVSDRGPGLTAEEQRHVWDRFYRSPEAVARQGSNGLGLGLYISRTIVERHGGSVGVESRPGEGATFYFTLPIAAPAAASR